MLPILISNKQLEREIRIMTRTQKNLKKIEKRRSGEE
jgi:hypothetical protein